MIRNFVSSALIASLAAGSMIPAPISYGQSERFENYEIRTIRPRFFSKRKRLELGSQFNVITNQTFIYTYMLSGMLTYHFTEYIALEGGLTYGFSIEKEDQRILDDDFKIKTQIIRTQYMADLSVLWTPIYGKYQLSSGRLIYFDTFLLAGVGQNGVDYKFDHCEPPIDRQKALEYVDPTPKVVGYTSFSIGGGQRYYLDKKTSIRWDVRDRIFQYSTADAACTPNTTGEDVTHHNITLQLGMSYFL